MIGDANKVVIRTFAVDGVEVTVRGSRYDIVKMMPEMEMTECDPHPFDSVSEMMRRCGDSPHITIIDRRELRRGEEKAAAWLDSGWPEQINTFDE